MPRDPISKVGTRMSRRPTRREDFELRRALVLFNLGMSGRLVFSVPRSRSYGFDGIFPWLRMDSFLSRDLSPSPQHSIAKGVAREALVTVWLATYSFSITNLKRRTVLDRLCGELGYTLTELTPLILYTVAAGAIVEVAQVKVGDVIVMGPATGSFGGAAVELALLSGASVIILGRREETLVEMKRKLGNHERLQSLVMSGDDEADGAAIRRLTPNGAGADIYNDWTPGWIEKPPFIKAGMKTLKMSGQVILSGAAYGTLEIPYAQSIHINWEYTARWTCTRATIQRVVSMVQQGILKIGKSAGAEIATFSLAEHEEAKTHAEKVGRFKNYSVIIPHGEPTL
ncbi:hypothetical protein LTR10_022456 [Elasticomyces elasticus]|uniref:Alcohol dehydrogenase-like C-terminal domain-containing protein n=1 Tax=Exophiala sideris TaxID=1016849 RepID=A0ABR0J301_9EURO|nr:hypothetical protein LTR10_022456 [Elasticomyces elasticus]KAK5024892.1 hypothetical protein LTS07_008270 [Exophiala sideris]KAK5054931.1 hypothetical protein LTR69_008499 [Exophiala sideris]KAK5179810.1 hypothetical protein LTR44_007626 [Eurotiomycetes sp. CCFEE 6388]